MNIFIKNMSRSNKNNPPNSYYIYCKVFIMAAKHYIMVGYHLLFIWELHLNIVDHQNYLGIIGNHGLVNLLDTLYIYILQYKMYRILTLSTVTHYFIL